MKGVSTNRSWSKGIAGLFLRFWLPVIVWMGLIFVLSDQPTLPHGPTRLFDLLMKKLGHVTEFAVLAVVIHRAWTQGGIRPASPVLAWLLSVAYALSDEYHQVYVPGRHGNPWDVAVDAFGAVIGLALFAWWRAHRRR